MISRRKIIHGQQVELPIPIPANSSNGKLVSNSVLQQVVGTTNSSSGNSSSGHSAASGSSKIQSTRRSLVNNNSTKTNNNLLGNITLLGSKHQQVSNRHNQMKQSNIENQVELDDDDGTINGYDGVNDDDIPYHLSHLNLNNQDGSSDGYIVNQYDDYMSHPQGATSSSQQSNYWRPDSSVGAQHHRMMGRGNHTAASNKIRQHRIGASVQQDSSNGGGPSDNYRHFDPYAIYNEDEDVWYSEERLFEDHLEEIYNKWRLLDDDIWCKLIIMERSRRIGKAYARVPIVTIDGSHELSYDGYKLALNGFDNPDRDPKTEECRKRIGKGIRIKMDSFGNILIKRLSKSAVYVKEWITTSAINDSGASNSGTSQPQRHMPSRQQLIKNLAATNAGANYNGLMNHHRLLGGQVPSSITPSSSSGGSSMEQPNDSAVCDEVLNVGGQLEQDKIYVMFDMKKFQANITQELCHPYPDKKKLEQQCFSIVGLVRNSDEILDLPCWVMVINIVAIQMLNERFPSDHLQEHSPIPPVMYPTSSTGNRGGGGRGQPTFVSIFDQANQVNGSAKLMADESNGSNKEEDPYSLPANASSSDVKSSINDYGTTTGSNQQQMNVNDVNGWRAYSRQHAANQSRNSAPKHPPGTGSGAQVGRSKSNHNIFGMSNRVTGDQYQVSRRLNQADRYNNGSSIYSPGHMLVPPPGGEHLVPPKLPPRDFVNKRNKSKSSSNVNGYDDPNNESIYSTGMILPAPVPIPTANGEGAKMRKVKKNRFLESLRAPLELANRSSSGARSASVIGAPLGGGSSSIENHQLTSSTDFLSSDKSSTKTSTKSSTTKNIKSFLGVKSSKSKKQQQVDAASDDSNYVHVESASETSKSQRAKSSSASKSSKMGEDQALNGQCNDLDIPTPDYETDENAYALEDGGDAGNYAPSGRLTSQHPQRRSSVNNSISGSKLSKTSASSVSALANNNNNNKEDLYYSGFRAHVPQNSSPVPDSAHTAGSTVGGPSTGGTKTPSIAGSKSIHHDKLSSMSGSTNGPCERGSRKNSRFASHQDSNATKHHLMHQQHHMSGRTDSREMIYGSTTHLQQQQQQQQHHQTPPMAGSRYRSASMQRYYPPSSAVSGSRSHRKAGGYAPDGYDCDSNPYAMSQILLDDELIGGNHHSHPHHPPHATAGQDHYGYAAGLRSSRRPASRLQMMQQPANGRLAPSGDSQYDIGRSSSGIYGNNSSSSSSDYADWNPQQMRKVNSGGYLNSIFKSHISSSPMHPNDYNTIGAQVNNNNQLSDNPINGSKEQHYLSSKQIQQKHSQHLAAKKAAAAAASVHQQQQNYTSKSLKSTTAKPVAQQQVNGKQPVGSSVAANGPTYLSYDSSNDSEPSYTNSSDGLDIYDHIGANGRISRHQFLDMQNAHNIITPEVHVGEWENMYDR